MSEPQYDADDLQHEVVRQENADLQQEVERLRMEKCDLVHVPCGACGIEIREDGTCGCEDNRRHPIGPAQRTLREELAECRRLLRSALRTRGCREVMGSKDYEAARKAAGGE